MSSSFRTAPPTVTERCSSHTVSERHSNLDAAAAEQEVTLLALPDDVLARVFQLLWPAQALLCTCKRLRALCHASATAVKLVRGYDGPHDAAHVAIMARCPLLARVDATAVACDEQWPLAQLQRVRRLSLPQLWSAANVPHNALEVAVPGELRPSYCRSWANAMALLAGLRERSCTVTLEWVYADEDRLGALSHAWMAERVRVGRLLLQDKLPPAFGRLLGGVLSQLRRLELYRLPGEDLTWCAAVAAAPLTDLTLVGWRQLKALSGLSGGLLRLEVSLCPAVTTLRGVSTLSALRTLRVHSCSSLVAPGVEWSELRRLTWLELSECSALTGLDWPTESPPLRHLDISGASALAGNRLARELAPLLGARRPRTLIASIDELCRLPEVAAACSAADDHLQLSLTGVALAPPPPLARLPSLRRLSLCRAEGLRDLAPLAACPCISQLSLEGCQELTSLGGAAHLSQLASLCLSGCEALTSLAGLSQPGACVLTALHAQDLSALASDDGLQATRGLRKLSFARCPVLSRVSSLHELRHLAGLVLYNCSAITSLEQLAAAPQLEVLEVNTMPIDSLEGIEALAGLKRLQLTACDRVKSVLQVASLRHLTSLQVLAGPNLTSLAGVARSGGLRELRASHCPKLASLQDLATADLSRVTLMDFRFCGLTSMSGIAGATALRALDVSLCPGVTSFAALSGVVLQQLHNVGGLRY